MGILLFDVVLVAVRKAQHLALVLIISLLFLYVAMTIFRYETTFAVYLTMCFLFVLAITFPFFTRVRAVTLVMVPQFFSMSGQVLIGAIITGMAARGPMANVNYHTSQLANLAYCADATFRSAATQTSQGLHDAAADRVLDSIDSVVQVIENRYQTVLDHANRKLEFYRRAKKVLQNMKVNLDGFPDLCEAAKEESEADCLAQVERSVCAAEAHVCRFELQKARAACRDRYLAFACTPVEETSRFAARKLEGLMPLVEPQISSLRQLNTEVNVVLAHQEASELRKQLIDAAKLRRHVQDMMKPVKTVQNVYSTVANYAMHVSLILLVVTSAVYTHRYRNKDSFDNWHVTNALRRIDALQNPNCSIFPLQVCKGAKVKPKLHVYSPLMSRSEWQGLLVGLLMMATLYVAVMSTVATSTMLHSFVVSINYAAHVQLTSFGNQLKVLVVGNSTTSKLHSALMQVVDLASVRLQDLADSVLSCCPTAVQADDLIMQLHVAFGVYMAMIVAKVAMKRLRHSVLDWIYPMRAKQRAAWLYEQLMLQRIQNAPSGFLALPDDSVAGAQTNSRRKMHMKCKVAWFCCVPYAKVTCMRSVMETCVRCDKKVQVQVVLMSHENDVYLKYIRCHKCRHVLFIDCFLPTRNMCPVCLFPLCDINQQDDQFDLFKQLDPEVFTDDEAH